MPSTSKDLKAQATGIKRTATGIRAAIKGQASLLTQKEREQLEKAVEILNRVGSKVSSLSKQTLAQEKVKEKATACATAEAKRLLSLWPQPVTILEKVALIVGVSSGYELRRDLEDNRPNAEHPA